MTSLAWLPRKEALQSFGDCIFPGDDLSLHGADYSSFGSKLPSKKTGKEA
jgi:hypothetical protein